MDFQVDLDVGGGFPCGFGCREWISRWIWVSVVDFRVDEDVRSRFAGGCKCQQTSGFIILLFTDTGLCGQKKGQIVELWFNGWGTCSWRNYQAVIRWVGYIIMQ